MNTCVVCDALLTVEASAEEHIIPNALGGREVTREATCKRCNSLASQEYEARVIKRFAYLAAAFDVRRDRGRPPATTLRDEEGTKFRVEPGGRTVRDYNLEVQHGGGRVTYSIFAKDRADAKRQLTRYLRRPVTDEEIEIRNVEPKPTHLDILSLDAGDPDLRRLILKTAVCFARKVGVPASDTAHAVNQLREPSSPVVSVGWPDVDIVAEPLVTPSPVSHGVAVFESGGRIWGHVVLFHALEAVVLLGTATAIPAPTRYWIDVVSTTPDTRPVLVVAAPSDLERAIGREAPDPARFASRFENVRRWLGKPRQLWSQRTISLAAGSFYRHLANGSSVDRSLAAARGEGDRLLKLYGLPGAVRAMWDAEEELLEIEIQPG